MLLARLWHDKRYKENVIWHHKLYKRHDCADDQHVVQGLCGRLGFNKHHDVPNCARMSHMGKQKVTLHHVLHYDDKTLSGGV